MLMVGLVRILPEVGRSGIKEQFRISVTSELMATDKV